MERITPQALLDYIKEYVAEADNAEDKPLELTEKLSLYTLSGSVDRVYDFFLYRNIDLHEQGIIHSDDERDAVELAIKLVFEALFGIK